jgi:UDP-N-acetylmuramoyl-L-alanyl-D-glutamate--2,6-diaminopimelate ligase
LRGGTADGHDFIDTAIDAGAVAIVAEQAPPEDCKVTWIHLSDARKAMAIIAAEFYEHPARKLTVSGVTGTNGKSTIAFIIHHLLNMAQRRAGLIGTMFYDLGGVESPATHTTPESLELQKYLAAMVDNGCRAVSMEVSSHALHQDRVHGINFLAGIFTNLTQDHLDYHHTMENYFDAKCILFQKIADQPKGAIIVNGDDQHGRKLAQRFEGTKRVVTFGLGVHNDFRASDIRYDLTGTTFQLDAKGKHFLVRSPLIGDFNVYNTLAALAAVAPMGANLREAITHLKSTPQVPGRLERISEDQHNVQVYVDYAHTPDAIVNVLKAARAMRPQQLITVFGCGGDRDRTKRSLMARAAEDGSDVCVLTSDNPRFEDPKQIMADARKGFTKTRFIEIEDRKDAIYAAIANARPGALVLVLGKGHETYQDVEGVKHPFDDRRIVHGGIAFARAQQVRAREEKQMENEARRREREFFDGFNRDAPPPPRGGYFDKPGGDSTRRWNS